MADHFEQAKDDILKRTLGNGGPTGLDLLLAIEALAQDSDDQHAETLAVAEESRLAFEQHCIEANVRDERIAVLDAWRHDQATHCESRIRKLIHEEHQARHDAYVAELGPTNFNARLLWFFATTGGRIALLAMGALIATLINLLIFGRP